MLAEVFSINVCYYERYNFGFYALDYNKLSDIPNMKALLYDIKRFENPRFVKGYGDIFQKGYSYETETHFVHFWSHDKGVTVQGNIPILQRKSTDYGLEEWIAKNFGAENITVTRLDVGHSIEGVWRPSLYYDYEVFQATNTTLDERSLAESSLRILLEKLDDLFLYIEPSQDSLNTYSHKTRELLIMACTEVETFWAAYFRKAGYADDIRLTTNHYVKLKELLCLNEQSFTLKSHSKLAPIKPFSDWKVENPTKSLVWYDAYNKTKHNRSENFSLATFENALTAVVANLVLYVVRFGPHSMRTAHGMFNTIVNQHFIANSDNINMEFMYVPMVRNELIVNHHNFDLFNAEKNPLYEPFKVDPLVI